MALKRMAAEMVGTFVLVFGGVGAAVIAQIFGGIIAAGVLLAIVAGRKGGYHAGSEGLGANGFGAHSPGGYPWGSAFAAEVVLTAFLVFTVLAATDRITARRSTRAARQWPPRRALSRRSRRGSPRRPSPGRSRSAPAI
jgi:glycerol uptake facilitator-like aquaporin